MVRPNYAMDEPPNELVIENGVYAINTDYRVWIQVSELILNYSENNASETFESLYNLVFGKIIYCNPEAVLNAIIEFLKGYPFYKDKENNGESNQNDEIFSFDYDLNYIILAIRNQSGIDLSYECKHFHWWHFLLEFKSLEKRHYISELMKYRAYDGKDKEMLKIKNSVALPVRHTAEEKAAAEELNNAFYNC